MPRKTREEKLQEKIDHLEDVLESLEHPSMEHIKVLYFNNRDEYFLIANTYRGKNYVRLGLERVEEGTPDPHPSEIAARNDDGKVTAKYVDLPDESLKIVKTLTKAEAIKKYTAELEAAKDEMLRIDESKLNLGQAAVQKAKDKKKKLIAHN